MAKGKQVYARIESEKTITQLAEECERRDISRPDFVREAIELHLKNNDFADVVDARDELKKQLANVQDKFKEVAEARDVNANQRDRFKKQFVEAKAEVKEWGEDHAVEYNNCEEALKELKVAKQEIEKLKKHNTDLDDMRKTLISQRDKFKQKFEEVVQTNEILLSDVREMQSLGVFARAFELKRFNTAKYVIQTGKDNETSA